MSESFSLNIVSSDNNRHNSNTSQGHRNRQNSDRNSTHDKHMSSSSSNINTVPTPYNDELMELLELSKWFRKEYTTRVKSLIAQLPQDDKQLIADFKLHLALHNFARESEADDVLLLLVDRFGFQCLVMDGFNYGPALCTAARWQSIEVLKNLLDRRGEKEVGELCDAVGDTLLHYAADYDDCAKLLLLADVLGNEYLIKENNYGDTPLHLHFRWMFSCTEVQCQLIKKLTYSNVNLRNKLGNSVIHEAAQNSRLSVDVLKEIKKIAGDSCFTITNNDLQTPLHFACQNHSFDVVADLVGGLEEIKVLTFESKDLDGRSPVHYAAENAEDETMILQLSKKLKSDCLTWQDNKRMTPLHLAARHQPGDTVLKLFEEMSQDDWSSRDADDCTPMHYAARNSKLQSEDLLNMLRQMNKNKLIKGDKDGNCPLHFYFMTRRNSNLIDLIDDSDKELLLMTNNQFQTPLHFASETGMLNEENLETVAQKLETDAEEFKVQRLLNRADCQGRNMLFYDGFGGPNEQGRAGAAGRIDGDGGADRQASGRHE